MSPGSPGKSGREGEDEVDPDVRVPGRAEGARDLPQLPLPAPEFAPPGAAGEEREDCAEPAARDAHAVDGLDVLPVPDAIDLVAEPGQEVEHPLGEEEAVSRIGSRFRHHAPSGRVRGAGTISLQTARGGHHAPR